MLTQKEERWNLVAPSLTLAEKVKTFYSMVEEAIPDYLKFLCVESHVVVGGPGKKRVELSLKFLNIFHTSHCFACLGIINIYSMSEVLARSEVLAT